MRTTTSPRQLTVAGLATDRYEPQGTPNGPPVVICHGGMDRAAGYRRVARHLPGRDLWAYDRRGYGGSLRLGAPKDFSEHATDLAAVCALVHRETAQPPVVVGHSVGGLIALHLLDGHHGHPGDQRRTVAGAVLFEAPLGYEPWYRSPGDDFAESTDEELAERFMRLVLGDEIWEAMPTAVRAARRAEGAALRCDMVGSRHESSRVHFGHVRVPVVVGRGDRSIDQHQRSANEIAAAIDGATLVVINDAGHGAHLSHPREFAALIETSHP